MCSLQSCEPTPQLGEPLLGFPKGPLGFPGASTCPQRGCDGDPELSTSLPTPHLPVRGVQTPLPASPLPLNAQLPAPCLSQAERGLCLGFFGAERGCWRTRGGRKAPLDAGESPAVATTSPFVPMGWLPRFPCCPRSPRPSPARHTPLPATDLFLREVSLVRDTSCPSCLHSKRATCRAAALPQPGDLGQGGMGRRIN